MSICLMFTIKSHASVCQFSYTMRFAHVDYRDTIENSTWMYADITSLVYVLWGNLKMYVCVNDHSTLSIFIAVLFVFYRRQKRTVSLSSWKILCFQGRWIFFSNDMENVYNFERVYVCERIAWMYSFFCGSYFTNFVLFVGVMLLSDFSGKW